jgi:hypothetical protein
MIIATDNKFALAVLKALGLEGRFVRRLVIDFKVGEAVVVTATMYAENSIDTVVEQFTLSAKAVSEEVESGA